ncbi:MAG: formylglycine-generating enzyme family protein, partial [Prochlorothrix sp.]
LFLGLGVVAFGEVVARSIFRRPKPMILTERPNLGACGEVESPLVYGDLVAGLPSESYGFTTVINLDAAGNGGQEVSREVTRWVEDLGNGVLLHLVRIPAGSFTMGSPDSEVGRDSDEGPQHQVYVPECWMGQFAVTQAQYRAITGQNPSSFGGDQNPVERVDWDQARTFCETLSQRTGRNYHLVPEAIWEYACRACSTTPFHFGETIRPDLVNYDGNYPYGNASKGEYRQKTVPVGSLPPNLWGLHEMHGNVLEWCEDPSTSDYGWKRDHPAKDNALNILPYSNNEGRVLRGGSWVSDARLCRSASRAGWLRGYPTYNGVFRVLLSSRTS